MSAILLDNEIVHYEVLGRGRPIIFLHGWLGSWRYWVRTMQATSTSFRSYALDFWGFGDTAKRTINYTLKEQVRLLESFLENLGIGKVAFIGHDLGAIVALLFADRHPQIVDRLMAVSIPLASSHIHPRLHSGSPADLGDWLLGPDSARLETTKADPLAIRTSLEDLKTTDVISLCSELTTPCLQVFGQKDPAILSPDGEFRMGESAHVHQIILEESGHFPMLEQPNKFNRLVADFLSLASGESPQRLQLKEEWKRRVR